MIVENFRPAVKDRLGIDYETIRKINPRLIYASLSGFGDTGPYRDRPGVDQIAQGMAGLMSITGLPGQGPVRVGIPICDLTAGIFLSTTVLMALYERERSGEGQWVKTSLLSAMIQMLDFQATRWLIGKEVPPQAGNDHPTGIPTGVFKTKDGHMNIAASGNKLFARLADALGKPEWKTDPVWSKASERRKNKQKMNAMIDEVTVTTHLRRVGDAPQRRRRAVGADLFDRPDVRRPAGEAARPGEAGQAQEAERDQRRRPGSYDVTYALEHPPRRP